MNLRFRAVSYGSLICIFLSGLAGLAYEIVFARYMALFLGHTGHAVIAVLTGFMGGMALGYFWLGTRADQAGNPLAFYVWLEVSLGLYGICFPALFSICRSSFL